MSQINTEVGVKINVDGTSAIKSVSAIKKEFADANNLLKLNIVYFGEYSKEVKDAENNINRLKNELKEATTLNKAFTGEQKFQAFSGALSTIAGGFTAITGAQALLGDKSKDLEKTLLKVQSALAISEGIKSIIDAQGSFKTLSKLVKETAGYQSLYNGATKLATSLQVAFGIAVDTTSTSFKVLRGAIISTGIGALVVALGLVINALIDFASSSKSAKEQQDALNDSIEENNKSLERQQSQLQKDYELELSRIKARGGNEQELFDLKQNLIKQNRALTSISLNQEYEDVQKLYSLYKRGQIEKKDYQSALEGYTKKRTAFDNFATDLEINNNNKIAENRINNLQKAEQKRKEFESARAIALKLQSDIALKLLDGEQKDLKQLELKYQEDKKTLIKGGITDFKKLNEAYEKDKKAITKKYGDERLKEEEDFQKQLNKLESEYRLASIEDIRKKELASLRQTYKDKRDEINANENYDSNQKIALLTQLATNENQAIKQVKNKFATEDAVKNIETLQKKSEDDKIGFQNRIEALNTEQIAVEDAYSKKQITEEQYNAFVKQMSDERIAIDIAEKEAKAQIVGEIGDIANGLMKIIAGTNEKSKGLAIASLVIEQASAVAKIIANTSVANAKAVASSPLTAGMPFVALNTISAGIGIASAIQNTIKGIQKIKSANANSSPTGAGGGIGGGGGGGVSAPLQPQAETTMLNQSQINQLGNASVRAFVVESDVSGNQERIRRLNRASRIN